MFDFSESKPQRLKEALKSAFGTIGVLVAVLVGLYIAAAILSTVLPPGCAAERYEYDTSY
jgi:hypothetical protein